MTEKKIKNNISRSKKSKKSSALQRLKPNISAISTLPLKDPLSAFLMEIQRYPLLSAEEEKKLSVEYVNTGDANIAAKLVTSNLRLVVKIAFEYRQAYRNIMDIIQEGNIGLMRAVKKFDPAKGVKLSTYAAWWIRAYILRFIINNWRLVKLGTTQSQRKLFYNLGKERAKLMAIGIDATPKVLAKKLGVTPKQVTEMDERLKSADVSLDAPLRNNDGSFSRLDIIPDKLPLPDESLSNSRFHSEAISRLKQFSSPLTNKEEYIFKERLMSESPMTLQEIGNRFNVSRERIRQIETKLLSKLRTYMQKELPDYFEDN